MNKFELDILKLIDANQSITQRELARKLSLSPAYINKLIQSLRERKLLENGARNAGLTAKGREAMESFKVDNAIILAAGVGSRFVPLAYDKPKGMIEVRGEPMVERMVKQLQRAGIDDITICVGYLMEQYEYLIDKYGVKLLVVSDFREKNNISSLAQASHLLGNTYILVSDIYMQYNPFSAYECQNWNGCVQKDFPSSEWYIQTDSKGRIRGINVGGDTGSIMLGPAYLTREFSEVFKPMLLEAAADPKYDTKAWEHVLLERLRQLPEFYARPMQEAYKLASLESLREFDPTYRDKTRDEAMRIIANVFKVSESEITEINPMKLGKTNTSFLFCVGGRKYIFRKPGNGSNNMVNRKQEFDCYRAIKGSGIADEPVFTDDETGVKITPYFENSRELDADNPEELEKAFAILRELHSGKYKVEHDFDHKKLMEYYEQLMREENIKPHYSDYKQLREACDKIHADIKALNPPSVMCHNDVARENWIVLENGDVKLLDWEYAGNNDPICEMAMYSLYLYYGIRQSTEVLSAFLRREPTDEELLRLYAYIAMGGLLWAIWCIYKEGLGDDFGDYGLANYRLCKKFVRATHAQQDKMAGKQGWQKDMEAAASMTVLDREAV